MNEIWVKFLRDVDNIIYLNVLPILSIYLNDLNRTHLLHLKILISKMEII
jgi:hypothetical protein